MNVLNAVLVKLTGAVLTPFLGLPAQVALIVFGSLAGVLAAVAFRYTSNQAALRRVADQVRANLLALRLFRDDLRSLLAAQLGLLKASGLRLLHSLPPLLVLIVPFVLLLTQLALWYEYRPLAPGESALVEVEIAPAAWAAGQDIRLVAPDSLAVSGPVRDPACHLVTWRITALAASTTAGPLVLRFQTAGGAAAEKLLAVHETGGTDELVFVSPRRAGPGFWDRLLHPGERAFDRESPVQAISIRYGSRTNTLFGLAIPWWLTFLAVSIVAALAAKPVIKVQF